MSKKVLLFCLMFCSLAGRGQYPGYTLLSQPEVFKKTLAQATALTESIQSDFSQEKNLTMLSEKIYSTGKFWFKKKDNLKMEYYKPYSYLIILSNGKIFMKDDQHESKISSHSSKIFQQVNRILLDCMAGTMLENPDFQSRVFENKTAFLIEFSPLTKNLKELYKNINIVLDKIDYSASAVEMIEKSGDKTYIRFQNKVFNAPIPDPIFNIP